MLINGEGGEKAMPKGEVKWFNEQKGFEEQLVKA